ncbi:hypothetical protein SAMN05444159_4246 [Bradyrhizobium lablabi]|uniref:Uncharacterized protein n=1 Tax=Bradyrhizobium lablabi TaxID=722472 RepID=A0A1M6VIX6_9BRAD|nr:hypothetical protein SAMN05444159_4246 [Bradyrhizobium lablabi]
MSQQEASDSHLSKWLESSAPRDDDLEIVRLSAARTRAMDEAGAAIARQHNGPLTALLLYMGEIKQHSHQFSQGSGDRAYLQQVVENALQQTERVCAMMKQIAGAHEGSVAASGRKAQWETRSASVREAAHPRRDVLIRPRSKTSDQARARSSQSDQRGMLQQARRLADAHQPADLREPSRRSDAEARRAKHRRSRPHRALAFGFGVAERVTVFARVSYNCHRPA